MENKDKFKQEIIVGLNLQNLVYNKDYSSIPSLLDKIVVPEGYKLGLKCISDKDKHGMGAESYVSIQTPDNTEILDRTDKFWSLISAEDSPMGAWQVYLLYNLWHYLPLFWHANYEKRQYIYVHTQWGDEVKPEFGMDSPLEGFNIQKYDIYPSIRKEDGFYCVSACYWSDFEGLVREELKIAIGKKVHVYKRPAHHRVLFHYECGICF